MSSKSAVGIPVPRSSFCGFVLCGFFTYSSGVAGEITLIFKYTFLFQAEAEEVQDCDTKSGPAWCVTGEMAM